jgi:hypothetical protein
VSAVIIDSVFVLFFFSFPQYQYQFTQPNMFIDTATALLFFSVFILAFVRLIYHRGKIQSGWLIFFAIFGLLSALDELQFIGHLMHYLNPYHVSVRFDDIHELIGFGVRVMLHVLGGHPSVPLIMASIGFALAIVFGLMNWSSIKRGLRGWKTSTLAQFLSIIAVLFLLSTLLDQGIFSGLPNASLWEEMIEFDGSLALLFCYRAVTWQK